MVRPHRLLNSSSHSTTPFGPTRSSRVRFLLTVYLSELSAISSPFHITFVTVVVSVSSGHGSRSILHTTSRTLNFWDSNGGHDRHLIILATICSSLFFHLSGLFSEGEKGIATTPSPFLFFSFSILPPLLLPCFFFLPFVLHCDGGLASRERAAEPHRTPSQCRWGPLLGAHAQRADGHTTKPEPTHWSRFGFRVRGRPPLPPPPRYPYTLPFFLYPY